MNKLICKEATKEIDWNRGGVLVCWKKNESLIELSSNLAKNEIGVF